MKLKLTPQEWFFVSLELGWFGSVEQLVQLSCPKRLAKIVDVLTTIADYKAARSLRLERLVLNGRLDVTKVSVKRIKTILKMGTHFVWSADVFTPEMLIDLAAYFKTLQSR